MPRIGQTTVLVFFGDREDSVSKNTSINRVALHPWLRFRLQTLLALTAVIAIALTFAAHEVREARRRDRARQQRAQLLNLGDYPGDIPLHINIYRE